MFVVASPNDRSPWNFQRLISVLQVSIKCTSRNFDIRNLRSGQFYDLSIISQWEKNARRLFWKKIVRSTVKHRVTSRIHTLSRNIVTSDPSSCRRGHFRSWKVASSFSAITFDRDQIEQWKHHRCVRRPYGSTAVQHNLSVQLMTLTWDQIFKTTFHCQTIVHWTRLKKKNTMLAKSMTCHYWL